MKTTAIIYSLLFVASSLSAQTREQGPWWPHALWGANDQAGGSNWITPEKTIKAVALVKTGRTFELGNVYEKGMPVVGNRSYNLLIPSFPTHGPFGENKVYFNDEFVSGEIGQVGTQFDGPGHVGQEVTFQDGTKTEVFYNGVTSAEMRSPYGLLKNGVENVKPIITRGILIDLAAAKGLDVLPDGTEVTMADVRNALTKEGLKESDIEPGDALLFNLGWWRNWPTPKATLGRAPHITREVAAWIISKQPSMIGSDATLDGAGSYVHTDITMKNGIWNLEFMNFQSIEKEKTYRFLFIFTPLRLKGATGSPGRPIAIF